jgi:outer membrane protein assembly factor BamA
VFVLLVLVGCDGTRYVADGDYLLTSARVSCENPRINLTTMDTYIRQRPNSKWLSTLKVPLGFYSMSGADTTKWINRTLRNWGQAPVVYDSVLTARTVEDLTAAVRNEGYLNAQVVPQLSAVGKRIKVNYDIVTGSPYVVRKISHNIEDPAIETMLTQNKQLLDMHSGQIFSVNQLGRNRNRITDYLNNHGYFLFNKEFISFDVDSSQMNRTVDVTMNLELYRRNSYQKLSQHPVYRVRNVYFEGANTPDFKLRQSVLEQNSFIAPGQPYSAADLQKTYTRFSRLQAIRYTNIHFDENPDSLYLDCHIQVSPQKTNSIQFQPEGTNTAGDLGAAVSLIYQNRNVFHGSELLNVTARGAYEAIRGLEGYQSHNYEELGLETSLAFPRFLFPWMKKSFHRRSSATSEILFSFNRQNRPEFQRRIFTAAWRYKWSNPQRHIQYKVDAIDVNFISMPWISETFKHDYLDSVSNRNAILRYNYENLMIVKTGIGYTYSDRDKTIRLNLETAGNFLHLLASPLKFKKNAEGQNTFLGIAYAQYVKGDADYTRLFALDDRSNLAVHARLGIAYPYGNSTILPFEKRYFAGGSNSVRGWSVRSLGPGGYTGKDGRIDFINQTGDIKLEFSTEMRSKLFWRFQSAIFVDAGNIWTIREYQDQPNGQFKIDSFMKQIAVAYGVGLRLNFDYFVVRLDMGMKAVNPAYTTSREHFPLVHPKFSRDHAFHFAVGFPF